MGALTMQALFDVSVQDAATSAQAWLDLAGALDDATEELIRGSRGLPEAWPLGDAADAAHRKVAAVRSEASNAHHPCRRIGDALQEHADTLRSLQQLMRDITVEATRNGFAVDLATGQVTAPARPAGDVSTAVHLGGYVRQLQDVLNRAADLDVRTSTVINANLPDAQRGFGSLPASAVSRAAVEAQRGRSPQEVHDWWESLTPEQQEQVLADYPALAGALDGVPATDRDTANRAVLEQDIDTLTDRRTALDDRQRLILDLADQGRLAELYPDAMNPTGAAMAELEKIKSERTGIDKTLTGAHTIENRLADPNRPPAFLLGFSSAGDGRAIVAVGDPDLSDNVVTYVPGTMSDLPSVAGDLERADIMAGDAKRFDTSGRSTSAILWLGYDAPDLFPNAAARSYANDAVDDLQSFQTGLRATHEGVPSHNTMIGHSYGSTTVGFAARDGAGLAADDLIFVGSPGVGVDSAADLHIQGDAGNVWGSTAKNDVIHVTSVPGMQDVKYFGEDPSGAGFGGRTFTTADGEWGVPGSVHTHSAYWDPNNPSRKNMIYIVTGQPDKVH